MSLSVCFGQGKCQNKAASNESFDWWLDRGVSVCGSIRSERKGSSANSMIASKGEF